MRKLREDDQPVLKNNVLLFPSLQAAPRDPPRPSLWRSLGALAAFLVIAGLVMLTVLALFE